MSKDFTVLTPNITVTMHAEFGVEIEKSGVDPGADPGADLVTKTCAKLRSHCNCDKWRDKQVSQILHQTLLAL